MKTILNDSGVIAEAAHYFCCCSNSAPARRWARIEALMLAVEMAVETYAAIPGSFADDYRRSIFWARRARVATGNLRRGLITQEKHASILARRDAVASAFGTRVLDAFAFSGREFACHLHPQNGTWAFKRDVVA